MKEFLKVGISGVRGVIGASFTPQIATLFAQAFGCFVGHGMVLVGRDTRTSGYMIERAIIAGLQSVGCKPLLVGIVPTPTLLVLTKAIKARGGILVTASHNPAEWNALKFVDDKGFFLGSTKADELFDTYHQGDFDLVPEHSIPSVSEHPNPMDAHIKRVLDYVDTDQIEKRKFKVAVDCCNGVGAVHSKDFLKKLGCEVVACLDKPNGKFERVAEPLPEHLGQLSDLVIKHSCDIGFAQDPDGDRLAIVDENGRPVGEDMTLAFAVRQVLANHEQGTVVANLSTSRRVKYVAEQFGCAYIPTKIGEIHVTEAMLNSNSVV
ncbi:MAG: phosphoglucosamine mutase, partial [Kiritimatiellae bacterium]|nr:phosphoglucosamine mutase [Kiritimatiellia bacterium]